jgi:hypothetical protein
MRKWVPVLWLCLTGCQSWDRTPGLWLYNNTGRTIYYYASCDTNFTFDKFEKSNKLAAGDSTQPYLLYGPEGKGPDDNPWVNAINSGDDSALHIYSIYIDTTNDTNRYDTAFRLIIKRDDYTVKALRDSSWRVRSY